MYVPSTHTPMLVGFFVRDSARTRKVRVSHINVFKDNGVVGGSIFYILTRGVRYAQ